MIKSLTKKSDGHRTVSVAVVGLSGSERDKGQTGVGKSCLCNRFVRSSADDYHVDHISVLSQSDFSGRVVNNDHFLYWGDVLKQTDDGNSFLFHVIEQTEFIDDTSFQQFKAGGKLEPYAKRCCTTKVQSAEKLMYVCKNQLGIEKEYEQKLLPDGKLTIDGFVCVFDVSAVPNRPIEKQSDFIVAILANLMRTKKPIVLATTKNDESNENLIREVEKIVQRKEFRGLLTIVETSAHENINVDLAFLLLAQYVDQHRCKNRLKTIAYAEAVQTKKEQTDMATEQFLKLIRVHAVDYRTLWSHVSKKLAEQPEWLYFINLLGTDGTQKLFYQHIKKLKEIELNKKLLGFVDSLPAIFAELFNDENGNGCGGGGGAGNGSGSGSASNRRPIFDPVNFDWPAIKKSIRTHRDFAKYFYECPDDILWSDFVLNGDDGDESRIPYEVLNTIDAENAFRVHLNSLREDGKRSEHRNQFKTLLCETGYITPGKRLSEVSILFMGRDCFEALTLDETTSIYENHQREIIKTAKLKFQELLLESADIFYHFKKNLSNKVNLHDDIKQIIRIIQNDPRYKILDRLDDVRKSMIVEHFRFINSSLQECCPAGHNCMDVLTRSILEKRCFKLSSLDRNIKNNWIHDYESNIFNLFVSATCPLACNFFSECQRLAEVDDILVHSKYYALNCEKWDLEAGSKSFDDENAIAKGSQIGFLCVYSDAESCDCLQDGLANVCTASDYCRPLVILFLDGGSTESSESIKQLLKRGRGLAKNFDCQFVHKDAQNEAVHIIVSDILQYLVDSCRHGDSDGDGDGNGNGNGDGDNGGGGGDDNGKRKEDTLRALYYSIMKNPSPDIRIMFCLFCDDGYNLENLLYPFLCGRRSFLSGKRNFMFETFVCEAKRKVEIIVSSYHGANAFREELIHGFVLAYLSSRRASLATLNAFSMNIPNLPIQIIAISDSNSYKDEISQRLIIEGNMLADRLGSHFSIVSENIKQKLPFYITLFNEVWEKKSEIEQAFKMEEPPAFNDSDDD